MRRVYIVPASGPEAASHYQDTIKRKRTLEEVSKFLDDHEMTILSGVYHGQDFAVWGARGGEGNRRNWERLNEGDYILFYQSGRFTLIGEIAYKVHNRDLAKYLWRTNVAGETWENIYFIINEREISVDSKKLNKYLGYKESFTPYGFAAIEEDKQKVFERHYGDIYDLIVKLNNQEPVKEVIEARKEQEVILETEEKSLHETTEHDEMQWKLIKLGLSAGNDIWVPKNDRNKIFDGNVFSKYTLPEFSIGGLNPEFPKTVETIDTVWKRGYRVQAAFEIEHSTSIYSGILRLSDLKAIEPNIVFPLYIVAPSQRRPNVFQQLRRPTFANEYLQLDKTVKFLPYEKVRDLYQNYSEKNIPFTTTAIDMLAEICSCCERNIFLGVILV